jgi:predicted alpha/beta hydrolase
MVTTLNISIKNKRNDLIDVTTFSPVLQNVRKNILILNTAFRIEKSFYFEFAQYLASKGFKVITYNYIYDKANISLARRIYELGRFDFEAVVEWCAESFPDYSVHALGHGIGGVIIGFTESCAKLKSVITVNSQSEDKRSWPKHRFLELLILNAIQCLKSPIVPKFGFINIETSDTLSRHSELWWQRALSHDCPSSLLRGKKTDHFNKFQGNLLSVEIEDDVLFSKTSVSKIKKIFSSSSSLSLEIHPRDMDLEKIGFFGFFIQHDHQAMWQMTFEWLTGNALQKENIPYALWNEDNFPLVTIDISSRQATDSDVQNYLSNMERVLNRGPVYLLINLTNVRWSDRRLNSVAAPFIRKHAGLIQRNHKGTVYVAPNFFIRNVLAIFHRLEIGPIIQPVDVFKNMEQALNFINRKMNLDQLKELKNS